MNKKLIKVSNALSLTEFKHIFKVMKLTSLFGVLCVSSAFAVNVNSQSLRVNIHANQKQAKEVIKQIEEQTDYLFVYNHDKVNLNNTVTIQANNETVAEVLNQMFARTDIIYAMQGNNILLMQKDAVVQQSGKVVTGTIVDPSGMPVIGANVMVKGTTNGTITDMDGKFSLEVEEGATLQISYIGYANQEIKVGNQKTLSIALKEDAEALDEVVVVGYGTQKKVNLTGAVAAINNKEIVSTKTGNLQNAIAGKFVGVKNWQKTSEPGSFTNDFSIRGMGAPLIVVDGVPRDNFTRLDANEVESISILKDASASIYGVRAANGVVLVTTKKGERNKKFQLDYTGYYGIQRTLKPERPLNALEYMELKNEQALNLGSKVLVYPKEAFEPYWNGSKVSTDWTQEINENVPQTYHSISAHGGTNRLDYYVGFGYNKENGIWKSGDLNYNRYNLRSNVTASLAKGLKMEVLVNLMTDSKQAPGVSSQSNIIKGMYTQLPLDPYFANNNENYPATAADGLHPLMTTYSNKSGYQLYKQSLAQTNLSLEWELPWIKNLKLKGMYSYDYTSNSNKIFKKKYDLYSYDVESNTYLPVTVNSPSNVRKENFEYINTLLQLSATYEKKFESGHNMNFLFMYEESERKGDNFWGSRDLNMDSLDHLFAGSTENQQANMDVGQLYHLSYKAIIGRINYDYLSKYLLEFSFRNDASSKNAPSKRWGFFPSASIGWRVSEEDFVKQSKLGSLLSNFKLRASYGLLGDDSATNNYQFMTGYNYPAGGYVFGSEYVNSISSRGMANPNISWYTSKIFDVGMDIELWNGLIGATTDFYRRDRDGLLATRSQSLPGWIGASLPQENLNSDMIQGWELTLTHRNSIGKLKYGVSGNLALSRSKQKHVERANATNSYDNWRNNTNDRWTNIWWGLDYMGQFQSFEEINNYSSIYEFDSYSNTRLLPGDLIYDDWNNDGLINSDDFHPISINNESDPILTYGFNLNGQYCGFDLNLQFEGVGMRNIRYTRFYQDQFLWGRNGLSIFLDRWHRADPFDPNCNEWIPGKYPSVWDSRGTFVATTNSSDPGPASSFWIQNGSYLRLKSFELGYTIPSNITKNVGIQTVRLFFNAYNLFTISGIKYVDPAHPTSNDGFAYPVTKVFNFGANVSF